MEERLTILNNICDKHVTVMNKNSEVYGAFRKKLLSIDFAYAMMTPFNRWKGQAVQTFSNLKVWNRQL